MKIICIGRNYLEHAQELQNEVPEEPVIFMKPETALVAPGEDFVIPDWTREVHHEIEVVAKISREGSDIPRTDAERYYDCVSVGIDFTARDVQARLKSKGHPWERAKAFDGSAVVGKFLPLDDFPDSINELGFSLRKNGKIVQQGNTRDMLFSISEIISGVSSIFTLRPGDLLFTGTPAGVGRVASGDVFEGRLEETALFELRVQ